MSGLTMGYGPGGEYTASSAKKIGDFTELPAPTAGNVVYAFTGSVNFVRHGRRPYAVQVLNDRNGSVSFCFDETDGFNAGSFHVSGSSTTLLNISPIAWSGSHADSAAGDVVFYFRGDM